MLATHMMFFDKLLNSVQIGPLKATLSMAHNKYLVRPLNENEHVDEKDFQRVRIEVRVN
jgi:hypothetical protein